MAITIRKKEGENSSAFLYRATSHIRRSGVLLSARKKRFKLNKPNKAQRKVSALHKIAVIKKVDIRKKLGLPPVKKSRRY